MSNDLQQQIDQLTEELQRYKSIVNEMTVPLIDSLLSNTLLLPLNGHIFQSRIEAINAKVFKHIEKNRKMNIVIMDFTGISPLNLEFISENELAAAIDKFNRTMKLLGVRAIYTGFQPKVVFELKKAGFNEPLETYPSYKNAINQIAIEKNIVYQIKE